MTNVQTDAVNALELAVLSKEIAEQAQKRMALLQTYMSLFEGAVRGNVNGDVFETLVADLKEQSENITGILVDNTDYVMGELEIASKFNLLFNQREVSEICGTVQSISKSMTDLACVAKSFVKSKIDATLKNNSIDESEFYKQFETEYLN